MKQKDNTISNFDKEQILFVTKAKFPDGNAFATYLGAIASVFKASNYKVFCIGGGRSENAKLFDSYFGKYVSLRTGSCKSLLSKIKNQLSLENSIFKYLKKTFNKPKHIFFSCEFSLSFYQKVKKLYATKGTKFSFILTEEYTKDEFEKYTLLSKKAMKINHHFIYDYVSKVDSFVVISRYLFKKMSGRGLNCVYIPFCFNLSYVSNNQKEAIKHQGINYIYCGNPENKDLLPTIIRSFSSLHQIASKSNANLNIIGVNEEWAKKHYIDSFDSEHIKFYGKRSKDFVYEMYANSDYSILLRDENKTFAKAGFPTKISESMILGVTPITNLTSNLADYLNPNNAIIVNGHSESDLSKALIASVKDFDNNAKRKELALRTAKDNFDIEKYGDVLLSLVNKQG